MPNIQTFPIEWNAVASGSFHLMAKNLQSTSPFSGRRGVSPIVQIWTVKLTLTPQESDVWMAQEAFFAELAGAYGFLRISDITRRLPQHDMEIVATREAFSDTTYFSDGTGFEAGLLPPFLFTVDTAARGETSVLVGGLTASQSRQLRRGDHVEFRRGGVADETPSLHILLRDASSNASGETLIEFRPSLRKGLAAGDQVVLRDPQGVFRLASDEQGMMERTPPLFGELGFELIEALI